MITGMPVAAHAMASECRVVERLREAHATQPHTAVPLENLRPLEQRRLHHLLRHEIVHRVEPNRYYLIESAWEDHVSRQRRIGLAIAFVMLVVLVITLAASRH
jgi:hypothetical protein